MVYRKRKDKSNYHYHHHHHVHGRRNNSNACEVLAARCDGGIKSNEKEEAFFFLLES